MAIRWRKKDTDTLKKLVNNYNAKIKRLEKKGYDPTLLPEKVTYTKVKNRVVDRHDFNVEVDLMKVFTARYSENTNKTKRSAIIPTFAMKQSKIKIDAINRKRQQQRDVFQNAPATDRNKKLGGKAKEYSNEGMAQLFDRKFNPKNMSKKDFEIFQKTLGEYEKSLDSQYQLYKDNFMKSFETVFGEGMDGDVVTELKGILGRLTNEEIMYKYYTDLNMNIAFVYSNVELELRYETIRDTWTKYAEQQEKKRGKLK